MNKKCPICNSENTTKKFTGLHDHYNNIKGEFFFNKCINCGHLFLGNPLKKNEIYLAYSKNYGAYNKFEFNWLREFFLKSQVYNLVGKNFFKRKLKILEVGAGEGPFSKIFYKLGHEVTATDIEKSTLDQLKLIGVKIKQGEFEKINFNKKYDLIILSHVIEHFYNPGKVVHKLKSLLKKDGVVFLKTPNSDFLFLELVKKYTHIFDTPRHISIFSKKSLKIMFENKEFNVKIFDEFILNDIINYFKIKYNNKYNKFWFFLLFPLALLLSLISYLFNRSSRILCLARLKKYE